MSEWRFFFVGVLATMLSGCKAAGYPSELPFVEDDFARAREIATRTQRPILVDVWASWCEPCREMRKALAGPAVTSLRDRFVWLAMDVDNVSNRSFFEQYPHKALPTLWVIDSATGKAALEWHNAVGDAALRRLFVASLQVVKGDAWDEQSVAERWIAALETLPAATPEERQTVGAVLIDAYRTTKTLERAIPILERLELDDPSAHAFPTALARVYMELGRLDEARDAIARAMHRVPPEQSPAVLMVAADVAAKRGDRDAERAALSQAIARADRDSSSGARKFREKVTSRLERISH